jgi:inner membrane protein
MDPLAHTLVGASLGETGLKRWTPLATVTLIAAANLPDIDALAMLISRDTALHVRRGWTHGVLAMLLLPWLLTGSIWLCDRVFRQRRSPRPPAPRLGPILALSYLGVLTHPFLDWLNTYGIRLLMPFDGRWFYGDVLFILDPWMWLLGGYAVILAHSGTRLNVARWAVLAGLTSAVMLTAQRIPLTAKLLWVLAIVAILITRWQGPRAENSLRRIARVALFLMASYITAMTIGTGIARHQASAWLAENEQAPSDLMAGPVPANPFERTVIARLEDRYVFLNVDWLAEDSITSSAPDQPFSEPNEIVKAALASDEIKGMSHFLRFPVFEVEERSGGHRVFIRDLRFSRQRRTGFGTVSVEVPNPR